MPRQANAIDFWRGFALVSIFINHIPGIWYERLTHQLGYFDILPLYVVLMLAAPAIALIDRFARPLLLPLSLALYFASLTVPFTAPTWPVAGQWFFNPFTWQAIFVLGFALSREK